MHVIALNILDWRGTVCLRIRSVVQTHCDEHDTKGDIDFLVAPTRPVIPFEFTGINWVSFGGYSCKLSKSLLELEIPSSSF